MYRITLTIISFLTFNWVSVFGQDLYVRDRVSHSAIHHAAISASGTDKIVYTNPWGKADISEFQNSDSIHITCFGYHTRTISLHDVRNEFYKVYMNEQILIFEEVVVSSSRFEEKKKDVAQQVEVIHSSEIQMMNQPTTAEVLQSSGKVLVQKSQAGGGSPILRGFEANKVLMVVDGVRMNNAIYRGGHLQNVITIDNSMLQSIEIVNGPGSVVYGSDALGGVMHFFTKDPILSDAKGKTFAHSNAFVRYASVNSEKTGHLDFNLGGGKLASLTSITYSDFGDLRQGKNRSSDYPDFGKRTFYTERINGKDSMLTNGNVNLQKQSGYHQVDILQKILFKPSSHFSHLLNFQYSLSSNVPRYDRLYLVSGGKPRFAEWYYGPQKRLFAAYVLKVRKPMVMFDQSNVTFGFQQIEESRYDRQFGKALLNSRIEDVWALTLNGDFEKLIGKHEVRYGFEGVYNKVLSEAFQKNIDSGIKSALDTRYPDGGSVMRSLAAYVTHTVELSSKFILNDGLRYSNVFLNSEFKDTTFFPFPFNTLTQKNSALNGNIGLIFLPYKMWRGRLVFSTGFRAPNVDDLSKVFESVPGRVVVPNPHLKPEYTYNFEAGISNTFFSRLTVDVSGYYTLYKNAITTKLSTFNGKDSIMYDGKLSAVQSSTNSGKAYIYGFNGSLNWEFTKNFSLSSSLNYTYGRIETDSTDYPLDHIPPVFGRTGLQVKLEKFRTEFFALYNGWKKKKDYNLIGEDNFAQTTPDGAPSWYTLNFRTQYFINDHLNAQFSIENILDRNYRVYASGISAPGRNFILGIRAVF